MTRNVGIYIYDEVEVLDLGGPFEVFSTASRMKAVGGDLLADRWGPSLSLAPFHPT